MASHLLQVQLMAGISIALGLVAIILQIYIMTAYMDYYQGLAPGVWSGLVFLLAGIVALHSSRNKDSPFIKHLWLLAAWSAFASIVFGAALIGLATKSVQYYNTAKRKLLMMQLFSVLKNDAMAGFGRSMEATIESHNIRIGLESVLILCGVGAITIGAALLHMARLQRSRLPQPAPVV